MGSQSQHLCFKNGPWRCSGVPKAAFGWPGALPGIWSDSGLHFLRKCCKTITPPVCFIQFGSRPEYESGCSGSTGSCGNGPWLAGWTPRHSHRGRVLLVCELNKLLQIDWAWSKKSTCRRHKAIISKKVDPPEATCTTRPQLVCRRRQSCCACRQDICCVCRQDIFPLPRHHRLIVYRCGCEAATPCVHNACEMSW